ncbi:MAG: hypothetical protein DRG80_07850 [Deltaproteobacteria bacterium]|nr:MAG: hypothetical protein DRG80_07850 [Deltaproteobacteria bacterium]
MAKALGQEPVQVPHWMQVLTISRIDASESMTCADAVSDPCSLSISCRRFMCLPFLIDDFRLMIEGILSNLLK